MSNETQEAPPDKAVAKVKEQHLGERTTGGALTRLAPQSFGELEHIAQVLAGSDIVPKDLIKKPANVLLVLMFGNEIGLTPAQALQNVMVVNGRPSLWGDAVMGLVESSNLQDWWKDEFNPTLDGGTWIFTTKRKGREPVVRAFSMKDAQTAKLTEKDGPWKHYPKRMLFNRARAFALRDTYPDVLKGLQVFEEARDVIDLNKTAGKEYAMPTERAENTPPPAATAPESAPAPAAVPAPAAAPEGNVVAFKVYSVAESDFNGDPAYAIRDTAEPANKYFTDNEAHAKLAKTAKEAGTEVAGVWVEKVAGKTKHRWLAALQAKA